MSCCILIMLNAKTFNLYSDLFREAAAYDSLFLLKQIVVQELYDHHNIVIHEGVWYSFAAIMK